ncbi:MAG: hypothetical protein K0Q64_1397 [Nitrobacter vulgaris]|jgi:hypothetical protein|nr:hypothetical protein [Nitrobacter vulgaris]
MSELNLALIRQAMVTARSVLLSSSLDTADDLKNAHRRRVLEAARARLTAAIAEIDKPR